MNNADFQVFEHPASRITTVDLGQIGRRKHHVPVLVEVDVTEVLACLQHAKASGQAVSFFAWVVKAIGATLAEHRHMHGIRKSKTRTVVFDAIDISVMVERQVDGSAVPLPLVIRRAEQKSTPQIYAEIRAAKTQHIRDERDFVLAQQRLSGVAMRVYYALPQFVRLLLLRWVSGNAARRKRLMGTVVVTSVGAVARFPGWVIPKAMHNLCFALGSVTSKPWVVDGRIEVRHILHLTVLFDHDVVDGVPAARFIAALLQRIESAAEFNAGTTAEQPTVRATPAVAPSP